MCGYFGNFSFTKKKLIAGDQLRKIANTITHRGPDGEGFYEDLYASLAFKRLSIIDIKNGNQPFISQNKKFVIVFNGEIYNFPASRYCRTKNKNRISSFRYGNTF
jgi:asparagine synthase (glutamine-hydrolysing)